MNCHVIRVISHPTDRYSRKLDVNSSLNASWPILTMHSNDDVTIFNGRVKFEFRSCDSTNAGEITSADIIYVDFRNGPDGRTWALSVLATTDAMLWTHTGDSITTFAPGKPLTVYHSSFFGFRNFIRQKFGYECPSTGWDIRILRPVAQVVSSTLTETPSTTAETPAPSLYDQWLADNEEMVKRWIDCVHREQYLKFTSVHYLAAYGMLDILKTAPIAPNVDPGVIATENNHLDVIKWLVEESTISIDEIAICEAAARRGFLHILKYMKVRAVHEGDEYITAAHLKKAASRGHFHVIDWADKNWYLYNQHCCAGVYRAAVRAGHVNIVQLLRKKYEITTFARKDVAVAARAGHLAIVQMAAVHTPATFSPSEIMSIDGIHPEVKNWISMIYDV